MESSIEITGLKEMERALLGLGAALGAKTLRSALRDAAKPIHKTMLSGVPVGTSTRTITTRKGAAVTITPGFLRSRTKIKARLNKRGAVNRRFGSDGVAIVSVGTFGVPYVASVEYGNSNMPAQPYIRPALSSAPQAVGIFQKRLARRIELARKRLEKKR